MAPSFAPGSNDPRVAYALGMVVKMLKTQAHSSSPVKKPLTTGDSGVKSSEELSTSSEKDAPVVIWQVKLEKLQRVLESPQVEAQQKQGLVDMIEDADSVQDVWTYLDGVGAFAGGAQSQSSNGGNNLPRSPSWTNCAADVQATVSIPMELGCTICCSDLMLKPVSLACGHSFCKYCLELWLTNRANCPTCRQPTASATPEQNNNNNNSSSRNNLHTQQQKQQQQLSVNLALQHVIASFYPAQLQELEKQSQTERFEQLRRAIREAVNSSDGEDLREILARLPRNHLSANRSANHQDQSLAVSLILESDVELQERVLAAEIHERLRKERLLREDSRRRHTAAYNTTGLSTQVDPAILTMGHNSTTTVRRGNSMLSMTNTGAAGKSSSSSSTGGSSLLSSFMGRKS